MLAHTMYSQSFLKRPGWFLEMPLSHTQTPLHTHPAIWIASVIAGRFRQSTKRARIPLPCLLPELYAYPAHELREAPLVHIVTGERRELCSTVEVVVRVLGRGVRLAIPGVQSSGRVGRIAQADVRPDILRKSSQLLDAVTLQ